jgi:hypothetical protein
MDLEPFYGKEPHFFIAASLTTRAKIAVNFIPEGLKYCVIFIVYT